MKPPIKLPTLPADKANHAVYGVVLACLAAVLATVAGFAHLAALAAVATAFVAGVVKELIDTGLPGAEVSVADAVATAAGGVLVALPLFVWGQRVH